METVNAISKVRFATAKPQTIHLHKGGRLSAELLCMEPGQKLNVRQEERIYYVVTGSARLGDNGSEVTVPAGQLAAASPQGPHRVATAGQQRLVCLVIRPTS
jgi:mannose-6-phosphate isomerase-like protein (cupin superfamily)